MIISHTPAKVVAQLKNFSQAHTTNIISHAADTKESSNEKLGSNCTVFEIFHNDGWTAGIKLIGNFIGPKFYQFWIMVSRSLSTKSKLRLGSKAKLGGKDMLFISVCVLKQGS